jgi:mycothiol synthase
MNNFPYIIRNYRPSDFEDYVKLASEAERLKQTSCCSPEVISESLRRPNYSPEKDLFIAELEGKVIGFMNLTPEVKIRRVILDCLVHQEHRRKGIAKRLLEYATCRAKELKAKVVQVNISEDNTIAKRVLPRLGFREVRYFLELRLPLAEIELPQHPPHPYSSCHLQLGEEEKFTQLQNRCFAGSWGYNPNTIEEMTYFINLSHRSREDIILIYRGEKPVGYCWTEIDCGLTGGERKGRIYMLGVEPDYRGKGIGKIALLAGLSRLKNKGVQAVELTVDSENEIALALYRSCGFRVWGKSLWYEKRIN